VEETSSGILDALAVYAHRAWSGWVKTTLLTSTVQSNGAVFVSRERGMRWIRLSETPFDYLTDEERALDYVQAEEILQICKEHAQRDAGAEKILEELLQAAHSYYVLNELQGVARAIDDNPELDMMPDETRARLKDALLKTKTFLDTRNKEREQ
jgi:hypothetical protein